MQFRTVATLEDEQLDAIIVPVFKEHEAFSAADSEVRRLAEWVSRESGDRKLFTATTHLQQAALADDDDAVSTRLVVVAAGKRDEFDVQRAWRAVGAGVRELWQSTARRIGIVLDTSSLDASEAVQSAVEGVFYSMWRPEAYRTGEQERRLPPLEEVLLVTGEDESVDDSVIELGTAIGEAVNWTRGLANEPANLMTPTNVASAARTLADQTGMQFEALDEETCRGLGMGSFLSVARGSDEPAQLVVLRYRGRREADGYDLAFVGKGITFDSGGISIKPAQDMHLMKYDMSGAAAVLAAAGVVARLGLPINLISVAPTTENLPGGHATKPGDVVTSMSGKTVEVTNTDAEGRLVLIDGVTYVQREGASRVVDVATLTGAIGVALGRHYSGIFGRPEGFVEAVRRAGEEAGERLWPMPLTDEYREEMKSEIADVRNSSGSRQGGAILGAAFIDAAVEPETEWAHLDIASTAWFEEDRPFSPKGPQGSAVRTLVRLAASIAARNR